MEAEGSDGGVLLGGDGVNLRGGGGGGRGGHRGPTSRAMRLGGEFGDSKLGLSGLTGNEGQRGEGLFEAIGEARFEESDEGLLKGRRGEGLFELPSKGEFNGQGGEKPFEA